MKQALTVEEVAERLAVEPKTVYRMLNKGQLREVKAGRLWRIPQKAFDEYLDGKADDEGLSADDMKAVKEGLDAIMKGDFVSLEGYEKERNL